jgi:hypothetical protein
MYWHLPRVYKRGFNDAWADLGWGAFPDIFEFLNRNTPLTIQYAAIVIAVLIPVAN